MKSRSLIGLSVFLLISSCGNKKNAAATTPEAEVITPVTITSISKAPMAEYVELNATSSFLQKSVVKASANGYLSDVYAQIGKYVSAGQQLFTLKTKEAHAIGNSINALDSTFKFSGVIYIKASAAGYVAEVNHQAGDYVQDGEQLAALSDLKSFVFVMNLPYELRPYVLGKKNVLLSMPDGKSLMGIISYVAPIVDSASQTQNVFISVDQNNLPVNVIAKVKVEKISRTNTISLPKPAVLADETQTSFWVMQVIDSTTAVKVPITKGIETSDRVEILSPKFSTQDKFVLSGNYGLADTAKIKIVQHQ